ncbi:hypothetical protein BC938DRAFT_478231 [Jimgerdemannia flammicorona]|uniref:F-box domain-containing protein n=1 Tax=Jimgerdemannia flammicorona TaxID=994334 RepID=A0A433P629_9FUNG|nr:hypothetical protein BC938DRAFT_478231 [Jimgerdemannia flammicorona]
MDTSTCLLSIPPEIITTIASYLPLTSVLQLAATNRCLRELIFDASALWKELCLVRECRIYDFSDEHVGSLIRNFSLNACNAVRQVDLSNAGPNITNQTLELILTHFPNIHTLRLNRCVNLTPSSIVELLVSLTEPSRAPRLHLPHLTHLYLQDDRRDAAHIALGNKVTLATIRMRLAQLAGRPTSPSEGDAFEICDLELCDCHTRTYASCANPSVMGATPSTAGDAYGNIVGLSIACACWAIRAYSVSAAIARQNSVARCAGV